MRKTTLKDYGYPAEGIVYVDTGGGKDYECPQEAFTSHTCISCKLWDSDYCTKGGKETFCTPDGNEIDPYTYTCDDIDYIDEWLDTEYGFRDPVRCEYSTDKAYEQACEAIKRLNKDIKEDHEERR